jgi:hypothetical protein
MAHKATRIGTGTYHYRGFEISNVGPDCGVTSWLIGQLDNDGKLDLHDPYTDSQGSLRDAKALVDHWLDD